MSIRMKVMAGLFGYLFFNSVMFGAIFAQQHVLFGLMCGAIAQIDCLYILFLTQKYGR